MPESEPRKPKDILKDILKSLQDNDPTERLNAIAQLHTLNYSSEAICSELEKLALHDQSEEIRTQALATLDLAAQRNVRSQLNKINARDRRILLIEIKNWETVGLLDKETTQVIRRRYDFDLAPVTATPSTAVKSAESIQQAPTQQEQTAAPVASPQPTLTQTLLSETSIKIALYLGAFFVIASAAILGAFVDIFRIPLLIIATIIFGGLSVAIRRRLPQPSFTLFIVFSFLLPITANVVEQSLNLSLPFNAAYWVVVSIFMALIWAGGAWLYESRLFSMTAFVSLVVAFYRIGDIFDAVSEFYPAMLGLAALTGLPGVWALKRWKDSNFALPLFLSAQLLQVIALGASAVIYLSQFTNTTPTAPLWNLASIFTWGFAFLFYTFSDLLFTFIFFPWLAAGTLFAAPWLIGAGFEMTALGGSILFFIWGFILAASSEVIQWLEKIRKYSLPILLVAIITAGTAMINGFIKNETTGFICALGVAIIFAILHFIRPRAWLWAFALLDFVIAYFAFFNLPFIQTGDIFFGYMLLGLSLLFLLPDLFFKSDTKNWLTLRIVPLVTRIYGALFTLWSLTVYSVLQEELLKTAIMFGVYTLFFVIYTFAKRKAIYGYLPALYLPLTIIFALNHFNVDAWLPALTGLAVLYFISGAIIRSHETWSRMLRNSALALGTLLSLSALIVTKEHGGWYALVIGLLFTADMYLSRNGWLEIGVPILFNIGAFLILKDFNVEQIAYHLLAYSLVWLITDMLAQLTFTNPRPLMWIVRGVGAAITIANFVILFFHADTRISAIGFGVYTLLFLTTNLVYRKPNLFYAFALTLPLFVTFLLREFNFTKWIHPVIVIAMGYYALGYFLRALKRASGWDTSLLFSGLGLGVIVSLAAPILGGLDAAIPVAFAATLWAVEAFWRKNVWLGFPTNGLYLLAYFIILIELKVHQPQFFSMGAALLGMIQHYLLTRAGSKTGVFIMGMLSQLTLLGTTYIQMVSNGSAGLIYFVVLFLQSIAVLVYGIIIRSRSLTFTPIFFSVVGVMSVLYIVVYNLLDVITTIVMIGCTGVLLIGLGILAVVMRGRITKISERLSDWKA